MSTMQSGPRQYQAYNASESFQRIVLGERPWTAIGDFLDDWARTPTDCRSKLAVRAVDVPERGELLPWGAFFAAMVAYLCRKDGLSVPNWTERSEFTLSEPWFAVPNAQAALRRRYLSETPEEFKQRNVFAGADALVRV